MRKKSGHSSRQLFLAPSLLEGSCAIPFTYFALPCGCNSHVDESWMLVMLVAWFTRSSLVRDAGVFTTALQHQTADESYEQCMCGQRLTKCCGRAIDHIKIKLPVLTLHSLQIHL
jgi:hypothetical protein